MYILATSTLLLCVQRGLLGCNNGSSEVIILILTQVRDDGRLHQVLRITEIERFRIYFRDENDTIS